MPSDPHHKFIERVRSEAGTAIAALHAELMPVVQEAVCAQLHDERTRKEALSNIRIFGVTQLNAPMVVDAVVSRLLLQQF